MARWRECTKEGDMEILERTNLLHHTCRQQRSGKTCALARLQLSDQSSCCSRGFDELEWPQDQCTLVQSCANVAVRLSNSRWADQAQDLSLKGVSQISDGDELQNTLLDVLEAIMLLIQYAWLTTVSQYRGSSTEQVLNTYVVHVQSPTSQWCVRPTATRSASPGSSL